MFLVTLSMSTVFSRTAYMVKNIDLRRSQSMPNYAPPPKKSAIISAKGIGPYVNMVPWAP